MLPKSSSAKPGIVPKGKIKLSSASSFAASFALIGALVLILKDPVNSLRSAKIALAVCSEKLLPTLFPAMAAVSLLSLAAPVRNFRFGEKLCRSLFALSGECFAPIVLSLLCGFPLGAKSAVSLYKKGVIDRAQAEYMAAFLDFASPAFVIGAVGAGLIGSSAVGLIMWLSQTFCALLFAIIFANRKGERKEAAHLDPVIAPRALSNVPEAIVSSFRSFLDICAFVIFFSLLSSSLLSALPPLSDTAEALFRGFFEMSSGVFALGELSPKIAVPLCSFISSFSGLSVCFQVFSFLADEKIGMKKYLLSRLFCAPVSAILSLLLSRAFLPSLFA